MKNKIISLVLIVFMMIIFSPVVHAEKDYSITIDFTDKVGDKITGINVNGTSWDDWKTNTTNTFYSDDDIYTLNIDYSDSGDFVPYILYDESWNDSITVDLLFLKGCHHIITIDNSEHRQNLEFTLTTGYKLSFETNGGSAISPKFVETNVKSTKPEDPIKKGFVFDGWYADELLSEPFDFNSALTKDTTIYAAWKEKVYSYEFIDGNNQELTIDSIKSFSLKIDGDYSLFQSLKVGKLELIKNEDYTVTEGSTIITFTDKGIAKLNALENGEYEILVKYTNNKEVKGKLVIKQIVTPEPEIENPQTGDNYTTYLITGIISLIGVISISFYTRRKLVK